MKRRPRLSDPSGYTLIEMACVFLILAIVLTAGVSYLTTPLWRSRTVDARYALGAIAALQYQHRIETGAYLACPPHPAAVPTGVVAPWRPDGPWRTIRFDTGGETRFQYAVEVGERDTPRGREPYFVAIARGDLDGDGIRSEFRLDSRDPREIHATNEDE